ncbi:glycoside hydrolase family 28 protein [Olivibacter sitiensis]|uniref:glycoside hydrolase family 28 protein n=1 Tax=Olivibacter sitiensis TaxID=376470 RepID=UPI0004199035|nr:glycosyl hydrolase family 28 protein [Olivibacter sitiensis]
MKNISITLCRLTTYICIGMLIFMGSCKKVDTDEPDPVDPPLDNFPEVALNGRLNVLDCGVIGDGFTDNTTLLQRAINECAAKSATVVFPKGTYFTRPLFMKSNVTLELEEESIILGSPHKVDYDQVFPNAGAIETSALIYGREVENVKIIGKGKIDGQGGAPSFLLGNGAAGRPKLIHFIASNNITLEDVQLVNSAFWTVHFLTCDTVKIKGVSIYSHSNWNNDGLDIDAQNVEIADCLIDVDDDALCFKSDRYVPCENITATNCILKTNCNAIKFGTASRRGFKNVTVSNCTVSKASEDNFRNWQSIYPWAGITQEYTVLAGIAVESVDGGYLEDVQISNIEMTDVQTPIFIRLGDRDRIYSENISSIKNVTISNITATAESKIASSITGVPEGIVEHVLIKDVQITVPGGGTLADANAAVPEVIDAYPENRMFGVVLPAYGFYVRHARNIAFENVTVNTLQHDDRPKYKFENVTGYVTD